ncbi:MAG: Ig domain-containing protein [Bacilli bacterium]|nr:Ig domain-containing protein [Bacilli bacterium]
MMKKYLKYICVLFINLVILTTPTIIKADGITLSKSKITIGIGSSEILKYTLKEGVNNSNIIWKSSNSSVATVQNGRVTGLSEGTTIITAIVGSQQSTCKVTVTSNFVAVSGIKLNKSSLSILIGSSETLTKIISPSNATNQDVTWSSSNPSVATVQNGKVTAKKVGTTIITASSSGYNATCKVTVIDTVALKKISLNKTSLTIKEKATEQLKITYTPSNATNKKVTWKSSNNNVVTVSSTGKITGVTSGTATITAISNDGGYAATCKVTVEAISKNVTNVSLDKKELKLTTGDTQTLKVTINPSYAENKNVIWSSSDESIAKVENGTIKALSPGTAEIKVITEDGNKEALCKVTVASPPIKGISFAEESQTVYVRSETILTPLADPENAFLENAIWTSSNEEIATVTEGVVKALSLGETTITVSNQDNSLNASINIIVINKPKEKLNITIDGYDLKFNPDVKDYTLEIGTESSLTINTNVSKEKVTINGNKNLKNGSIITITITDEEKAIYVINIKKKGNYTIYFIAAISVLLLINLIRILIKNKKKSEE